MNIVPTQDFVLLQFRSNLQASNIVMPDGVRDYSEEIFVQAIGPDVPTVPGLPVGSKVLLRGDANPWGVDRKDKTVIVPYAFVMAIVAPEPATN